MTLLEWRDDFRVGIEEVDQEHQEIIGLINELHATLGAERTGERVEEFLGEIFARISAHFALEEKVMQARRYDDSAAHKTDHERLLDDLRDIMDAQAEGSQLDDAAFSARLGAWFGRHFQTHDARLHKFLVR